MRYTPLAFRLFPFPISDFPLYSNLPTPQYLAPPTDPLMNQRSLCFRLSSPIRSPLLALSLALLRGPFLAAAQIPFVLPWNDAWPGATDLSALNQPIGTDWVGTDTNGHFTVRGQRLRFLGVNFAGDSPFIPTNNADAVAARLAKFGVNSVRFHHMDAAWAYRGGLLSYTSTSSTNVNASNLERLHYLVSRLKAHGIYSDINLLVGREYRSGDGLGPEVTGMDWKDAHILGFFYEPALRLHKDYATKLLGPTNRFTGLPLAKDPAVAFVEIINENGIIQKWLDGGLDRLAQRYATNLQARWNGWLAGRYQDEAALLAAWGIIDQPLGTNHLRNGAFASGLSPWNGEQHSTARATFTRTLDFTNSGPSARVQVTTPSPTSWHVQFNQAGLRLVSNQVYTISFWAKSSPATNADVAVMRAHTDYAGLGFSQGLNLTTQWQQFTATFQAPVSETNARVNFGSMGNKAATFWFADARFQTGGKLGTFPEGASLAARTVPNIRFSGSGYTGTRNARADWLSFLRDLENEYYREMVGHVRTNLGYPGLIFGTIMANSPATVQSRLDVIDGHSYWQHPEFPGNPWDSVNWLVQNVSMVNTLDNTLSGLARQRIKGKPFTVTEYQHSSPNYYGAEGPLLLAAYAGLQDWDGLWLFDYGHGNDTVTMGYVRGFFEIGQHPTKMANLLLAAHLFRRHDIQPARHEIAMRFTPERELQALQNTYAWGVFSSSQLGVPGKLAFTNRLSTAVGAEAQGLNTAPAAPSGNDVLSDTGELRWNASVANKGLVTINSPRTKGLVGFADNQEVQLGTVRLRPGTTLLGWCTLGITLKSGQSLTNDCTALIVATGWWENTGQVWKDSNKNSVGNQWGRAPVLAEVVPFTITLPVPTNQVRVWSLNTQGARQSQLPISGDSQSTTLTVGTNAATIWYEVQIGRWVSSFEQWRSSYFTAEQLQNPALSGPAAAPDDDQIPNLLKYYLGLPGAAAAPVERRPSALVIGIDGQEYLAMLLTRDARVTDVRAQGQASSDLANWSACCAIEAVSTNEQSETVVVRDLAPLGQFPQRFLRLSLERVP